MPGEGGACQYHSLSTHPPILASLGMYLVKETQEVIEYVKLLVFPFFPDFCHQKRRDAGQEGRQGCLQVKGILLTHFATIGTTRNTCSYLGNIPQLLSTYHVLGSVLKLGVQQ